MILNRCNKKYLRFFSHKLKVLSGGDVLESVAGGITSFCPLKQFSATVILTAFLFILIIPLSLLRVVWGSHQQVRDVSCGDALSGATTAKRKGWVGYALAKGNRNAWFKRLTRWRSLKGAPVRVIHETFTYQKTSITARQAS